MSRSSWTDERLDDLNHKVDDLGRRMDNGFDRVDDDLRLVHTRIDALQRTMIQVGGGLIAAMIGLIATQL
ncbi:MAG TPA: hypothetical protein VF176_04335 [Solirubrobacterales bacterium]